MLEWKLQELLISTIRAGITAWAGAALPATLSIQQAYQPRQQGVPIDPAIFIYHKGTVPRGYPKFENYTDPNTNVLMRSERQRKESTYQIGALVLQSPATPDQLTESDVLEIIRHILQGAGTLAILNPLDVGVFRITAVNSNYFTDDRSQNENNPIFDITLSHHEVVNYPAPAITTVTGTVNKI